MLEALRQPKWIVATAVVALLGGLFIYLGFWQLDRRQARIEENEKAAVALAAPVTPISDVMTPNPIELEYRRISVDGVWNTSEEVLIRSQVHQGTAGFHVVTPYLFDGGTVLVNRGWVPLTMDTPPVPAEPESGPIEGWLHLTQERGWLGPLDQPGELDVLNRIDVERIQEQVSSELAPFYLVQIAEDEGQLPVPIDVPSFTDEGPHLAYAIQWFGFAAVGFVGFIFLIRRNSGIQSKKSSSR